MKNSQTESVDDKKYIVLIIYDITDNKTRNKMVACLEKYGVRVQKSAFEAYITKRKYQKLMQEAPFLIDTDTDSLRIYLLDSYMAVHSWGRGDTHTEDVIIL
ncbi:CRISPR-associated endonuclease Cas2 [Megasphaera sp.]|uniref:CRISPR-associated endonuclease Cas2 n=1 Tax=Megasphaera sp. TaxID=2023260 RepID=UPI0025E0B682|nr:CRISPR-associated endonuclease Cas2 [uncultured Megasphaera sp.]